jgi:hypothetical protein
MNMQRLTIIFGIALILLGAGGYISSGRASVTALIPAFFGLPLLLCGFLSIKESRRMMVMHIAILIGLFGAIGSGVMGFPGVIRLLTGGEVARPPAVIAQTVMAIICILYVLLCIKSFKDARKARDAEAKIEE